MKKIICLVCTLFVFTAGCDLKNVRPDNVSSMLTKSAQATSSASRPISDQEEYFIGRAVAARILATYPLLKDKKLTDYVNMVGQSVALNSDKPTTFGGYHFAILDTNEVNAFACPGGTILITKGMLRTVRTEDELAAVLAHEVGHICHRDGIEAISKARWTQALTIIGSEAVKTYGSHDVARLTNIFEGSIDDVFKTLVVNGYGRSQENNADKSSLEYLSRTGYDPGALEKFLVRLAATSRGSGGGIMKTHPATADRIESVRAAMPGGNVNQAFLATRTERFSRTTGQGR
jgi:beta-barrel assembly-enhancing protease